MLSEEAAGSRAASGVERVADALDVIVIPDTPWDRIVWTNRQHVMVRLPAIDPNARVLYVAPPRLFTRKFRGTGPSVRGPSLWTAAVSDRLWVVQPLLPLPRRWLGALSPKLVNRLMIAVARRAARRLGFVCPCVWTYAPLYEELAGAFEEELLVYDVVDDYGAMPYYRRTLGRRARDLDRRLTQRADVVFVVNDYLFAQRSEWNGQCRHVGNAGDVWHYASAREGLDEPDDVRVLRRPRIGFHGTLTGDKLDLPLLQELVGRRPDLTFVFIGPDKDPAVRRSLGGRPHVHFLGPRDASELPPYVASFDVLLIPYRKTAFTGRPLKVYEGLAAGVPVVTTGLPELEGEPGVSVSSSDPSELDRVLTAVLSMPPAQVPLSDLAVYSWEDKTRRQSELVREVRRAKRRSYG